MMMLMIAKLKIFMKKDKINKQLIKIFFEGFGLLLIINVFSLGKFLNANIFILIKLLQLVITIVSKPVKP